MTESKNTDYQEKTEDEHLKDSQNSAFLAAATIILFSGVYWAIQIESVKELLILARRHDHRTLPCRCRSTRRHRLWT